MKRVRTMDICIDEKNNVYIPIGPLEKELGKIWTAKVEIKKTGLLGFEFFDHKILIEKETLTTQNVIITFKGETDCVYAWGQKAHKRYIPGKTYLKYLMIIDGKPKVTSDNAEVYRYFSSLKKRVAESKKL